MNHLPLIIQREYLTKVRNKSFLIMTVLSPLIFIALITVVVYLSQMNNNKQRVISVLDDSGMLTEVFKDTDNTKYNLLTGLSLDNAKTIVEEKGDYGLLHINKLENLDPAATSVQFDAEESPSLSGNSSLENKIDQGVPILLWQSRCRYRDD